MDWNEVPTVKSTPNFDNLLKVLEHKEPDRPTLFEFFLNAPLYVRIVDDLTRVPETPQENIEVMIRANTRLGYDFTTLVIPRFSFSAGVIHRTQRRTISLNEGSVIHNRVDFDAFPWPDPDQADYDILRRVGEIVPKGMMLIPYTPNGILENVTDLVGYQDLCMMIIDDPQLAYDIFDEVGKRLLRYYERLLQYPIVGAAICNDDWGFNTQTQFSPKDMRKFVFPWHKRFVETIHAAGRPAILHSCGYFGKIIEDIIEDMKFDARHSYEDNILPVEEAYELYHPRLGILGGIDLDFVCRSTPEEVYARSKAMLERSRGLGSYALGTGNSVPDYVPDQNYFAMIRAALDQW